MDRVSLGLFSYIRTLINDKKNITANEWLFAGAGALGGALLVSGLIGATAVQMRKRNAVKDATVDDSVLSRSSLDAGVGSVIRCSAAEPPLPPRKGRWIICHVGSSSAQKVQAAQLALCAAYGCSTEDVIIRTHGVSSMVPEQPVGDEQTLRGALNRLNNTLASMTTEETRTADYIIAIENGITFVPCRGASGASAEPMLLDTTNAISTGIVESTTSTQAKQAQAGIWYDKAAVVVQDARGNRSTAWSAAIRVPAAVVDETQERGFDQTDIGAVGAQMLDIRDPKDPHLSLTRGTMPRRILLQQALIVALTQAPKNSVQQEKNNQAE